MTWSSYACSRGIASCAQRTSPRLSTAHSTAPMIDSVDPFTPDTSIAHARGSTTIRPRARLQWCMRSPISEPTYSTTVNRTQPSKIEWSGKNREAGRPFMEHQLEIVDFQVPLERAVRDRCDIRLIRSDELIAAFPEQIRGVRNPLAMRTCVSHSGSGHDIGLIPDLIFGLGFQYGSRRCFMVEIDRIWPQLLGLRAELLAPQFPENNLHPRPRHRSTPSFPNLSSKRSK
ncbi:hypothetical protein ACVIGA_005106 [Bradyrhizobium sp. USDA 3240]